MNKITKDQAFELLDQAVIKLGADNEYKRGGSQLSGPSCVYVRNGEASCIVATALAIAGVPVEVMAEWDKETDSTILSVFENGNAPALLTREAAEVFQTAQMYQDTEYTFGRSVELARAEHQ